MTRDVLHKPPVALVAPDPDEAAKRRAADRYGNTSRAREVAAEPSASPAAPPRAAGPPPAAAAAGPPPAAAAAGERSPRPPAFAAAYFNKDVAATDRPSPRAQSQRALRGASDATDLKKIVLPGGGAETVSPEILWQIGERMALTDGPGTLDVRDLLARLGTWAQGAGMSAERLRARIAEVEAMVEARRHALERMPILRRRRAAALADAGAQDAADEAAADDDPVAALAAHGNARLRGTTAEAAGLHRRLARTLGIKGQF